MRFPFPILKCILVLFSILSLYNGYLCTSQKLYVVSPVLNVFKLSGCLAKICRVAFELFHSNLFLDRLTFSTPRRPFERERLDQELRICGEFGLRCKREIWRVQLVLAKIRKVLFSA